MNFSSTNLMRNCGQRFDDLFSDCRENCRNGCNDEQSEFNIDNDQTRGMVITCWVIFGLCALIIIVTLPVTITYGMFDGALGTSLILFYCIVGFFFIISCIANFISCRSLNLW